MGGTAMGTHMNKRASLSSFLNGTFEEISANSQIILLYLAIVIPIGALAAYFDPSQAGSFFNVGLMVDQSLLARGATAVVTAIAAFVIGLIAYYWLIAAMVRGTTSPGFDRILPFIGILILSWIGIGFGMVLLIVPGIILAVRWIALMPCVVMREDNAMDAFGDSNQMTQGFGWSIFGAGLILIILTMILSAVVGGIGAFSGAFVLAITSSIVDNLASALFAAFAVTVYRQLSIDSDQLAEVFE